MGKRTNMDRLCSIPGCSKPHFGRGWCQTHHYRWRTHGDPLGGGTPIGEPENYYLTIVLAHDEDECLIWPYAKDGQGYPRMGKSGMVHRLVCEKTHGPAPTGKHQAAHRCGVKACVAKAHLRWATRVENEADKLIHGTHLRGERQNGAKLTEADVLKIRSLRGKLPQSQIAQEFGVMQQLISRIQTGQRWAWLKSENSDAT